MGCDNDTSGEHTVEQAERIGGGRAVRIVPDPRMQSQRLAKIGMLTTKYAQAFKLLEGASSSLKGFIPDDEGDTWKDVPIKKNPKMDAELDKLILNGNRNDIETHFDCAFSLSSDRRTLHVARSRVALPQQ